MIAGEKVPAFASESILKAWEWCAASRATAILHVLAAQQDCARFFANSRNKEQKCSARDRRRQHKSSNNEFSWPKRTTQCLAIYVGVMASQITSRAAVFWKKNVQRIYCASAKKC
jgi:hypothetical protein